MIINSIYYNIRPLLPRYLQISIRRKYVRALRLFYPGWPIMKDPVVKPTGWAGWPEGKKFAVILTHDVETDLGQGRCLRLMELEKELGFVSSFNFVPERYIVSESLRNEIVRNGYEVGVHDLKHDGKLYISREKFIESAGKINAYLKSWNSVGFRSGAMHHNLEWLHMLNIEYDASTFEFDPFEPQSDGVGTIFPFLVRDDKHDKAYMELAYTLPQDFTLFILMKEKTINIWKEKLDWIAKKGGMAMLNIHPDYINFTNGKNGLEEYPVRYYREFLEYIDDKYKNLYWNVLPKEVADYCRKFSSNNLHSVFPLEQR